MKGRGVCNVSKSKGERSLKEIIMRKVKFNSRDILVFALFVLLAFREANEQPAS